MVSTGEIGAHFIQSQTGSETWQDKPYVMKADI